MEAYRNIVIFYHRLYIISRIKSTQFFLLLFFLVLSFNSIGQTSKNHYLGFSTQYHQIKEAANYGLVSQGLNLSLNYLYESESDSRLLTYTPHIAFGANYRNGIGMNWYFKLVDFFYGFKTGQREDRASFIGLYGAVNNFYALYPELQSGHMFWFTTIEIGPKFQGRYRPGEREITLKAGFSLYGLTSRPVDETEQYYYSLKFSDVLADSFSDMQFGSNNLFNHTFIEFDYTNQSKNKIIMGYAFEYFGYYDAPKFSYMSHSITLKWRLGK